VANLSVAIELLGEDKASGQVKNVQNALSGLEGSAKGPLGAISGLTQALGGIGVASLGVSAITGAFSALGSALVTPISRASDMNEALSKNEVIFGDSAKSITDWAAHSAVAMGQSKAAVIDATGTFGNLFTATGMNQKAAADLSKNVVQLATDLASFDNVRPEDALEKLRSGLVGESEPLRDLGVNINEAMVKEEGLKLHLADAHGELSEGAKIQARYALILEQTTAAQGDFSRTSTGMANSTRIISASFDDMVLAIGQRLLPIVAPLISNFAQALPTAMDTLGSALDFVAPLITMLGDGITTVANTVINFIKSSGDIGVLADNLKNAFGIDLTPFVAAFTNLEAVFFQAIGVIDQINTRINTFFADLLQGQTLATAVNAAFGDLIPFSLNQTLDEVDQAFVVVKQTLNDLIQDGILIAQAAIAGFAEAWAEHGASIEASVSELWQMVTSTFAAAVALISQLMQQTTSDQQTAWQTILQIVQQVFPVILSVIDFTLRTIVEIIRSSLDMIRGFWQDHGDQITAIVQALYEGIRVIVNDVIVPLVKFIGEQLQAIYQLYVDNKDLIDATVAALWSAITTVFNTNMQIISAVVSAGLAAISAFWSAHGEDIKRIVTDVWEIVRTVIDTALTVIGGLIKATMQVITGDWEGAWNTLADTVKKAWDNYQKIIKAGTDIIITTIKAMATEVGHLASEFFKAASDLGQSVIDGLLAALKNGGNVIVAEAEAIIRRAIQAAKNILRTGSPSLVFFEFGRSITDGLVYGMRDGAPDVEYTISSLLAGTIDRFNQFHSDLANLISRWGHEISPLNPDAAGKMVSDLESLSDNFVNATKGFEQKAFDALDDLNQSVRDKISTLYQDAADAIKSAEDSAATSIQQTLQSRIDSITLRTRRDTFAQGQKEQSTEFRRQQEDAEAAYTLQRDLDRAAADEKKRLAVDVARATTEAQKQALQAASAARLADTQQQLKDRAALAAEDLAHRREVEDKATEFSRQQALDRQAFEDKISDEALQKRVQDIKDAEDARIQTIKENLVKGINETVTGGIAGRSQILQNFTADIQKARDDMVSKVGNIITQAGINIPAFKTSVTNEITNLVNSAIQSVQSAVGDLTPNPDALKAFTPFAALPNNLNNFWDVEAAIAQAANAVNIATGGSGGAGEVKIFNVNLTGSPVTVDEAELMRMIQRLELLSNAG